LEGFLWKRRGYQQFVIGVPIIHGFQRQGEKIHVMNREHKEGHLVTGRGRPARLSI